MKTTVVMEHMPKKQRTLPTKVWRVVERPITEKGKMLKTGWSLLAKDLTLIGALHAIRVNRANEVQEAARFHK